MDRATPVAHNEEIELYIRTYYSLLRSSGAIRVRSLEDTHAAMNSNLHYQAAQPDLDMSALSYAALRLPDCIPETSLLVLGQMEEVFNREGYKVQKWKPVRAPARRRKFYFDAKRGTLAAFVASVSDIDDIIPTLTAYQIEWNKINEKLNNGDVAARLRAFETGNGYAPMALLDDIRRALDLSAEDFSKLGQMWPGHLLLDNLQKAVDRRLDLRVTVLGSGLSDYRRAVQHWWGKIEAATANLNLAERPIYFVSSNIHSMLNLISGAAWEMRTELDDFIRTYDPEGLRSEHEALTDNDTSSLANLYYYVMRHYANHATTSKEVSQRIAHRERKAGVVRVTDPHCLDVEAQIIEIGKLRAKRMDPRLDGLSADDWALLRESDAIIFNIDYPLGMAAYHIFSQMSTAINRIQGVYIMGKAATLNGRVGDVMIPNVIYDEHSKNSYLFRNCFTSQDVSPYLNFGTVFDNQKAVTVRGTLLQNRDFMHVFYEEGYTDIEMEAGPYLSAIYEDIYPKRYPVNEIVNLFINAPYDIGLLHYASDTPISKRQMLLSKSLSYFGVDATYATSVAILGRVLANEVVRMRMQRHSSLTPEEVSAVA